jgi:predicted dinucleotide-binding enzyme
MHIGILGSGEVAQALAAGFLKHGHSVTVGTRHPAKLAEWQTTHPKARVGSFADAAASAEVVVLSVKGSAAADALRQAGRGNLAGKVVIDTTNPIADAPPDHGVLEFFTTLEESLMEKLQREFGTARFVKAFNSVGADLMVNPKLKGGRRCSSAAITTWPNRRSKGSSTSSDGRRSTSALSRPRARSSRCASSGAFQAFSATSGPTRSSSSRPELLSLLNAQ